MAPKGSGVGDYVGMFACTAGLGLDDVIHQFKEVRLVGTAKGGMMCLRVGSTAVLFFSDYGQQPSRFRHYARRDLLASLSDYVSPTNIHTSLGTTIRTSWLKPWLTAWQRRLLRRCGKATWVHHACFTRGPLDTDFSALFHAGPPGY